VRLGIHPGQAIGEGAKFVLAPFKRAQKQEVEETVGRAAEAVESILAEGVEKSMTVFNRRAQGLNEEEE
jgi:PTH1 family peptidyl-tRNA hydrolase